MKHSHNLADAALDLVVGGMNIRFGGGTTYGGTSTGPTSPGNPTGPTCPNEPVKAQIAPSKNNFSL